MMAGSVAGQTTTGSIFGTVSDQTGYALSNATVTVTNVLTGIVNNAQCNDSGNYIFPSLPTGDYTVSAQSKGFSAETQSGIHLDVNQNVNASFRLKPGAETQ